MNWKIANQYQIMSIPTLLVFKNRRLVDHVIGAMPKQILEPKMTRYLGKSLLALALPFMEIPIKEDLMRSVQEAVRRLDVSVEAEATVAKMS